MMWFRCSRLIAVPMLLAAIPAASQAAKDPVDAALSQWDLATASALAAEMPAEADRCAIEGIVAERENRLAEAARLLSRCAPMLEKTGSSRADLAVDSLVNVYRRQGDYRRAYRVVDRWLRSNAGARDTERFADTLNEAGTLKVLRRLDHRAPTGATTASLSAYRNLLGTRSIDLTVRGVTLPWMVDTGANYSVVSESAARRMGLTVLNTSYKVSGITGNEVATRLAVIDALPVGGIVLHDVVALVVPDASLLVQTPTVTYQIEAALGYPALAQLGQFRIDPDGTFTIDRSGPPLQSGARLLIENLTPLLEAQVAGSRRLFKVDTGANRTDLYASYAALFADSAGRWARKQETTHGLGGRSDLQVAVEPELEIKASGVSTIVREVSVALQGDRTSPILGNLGQSFLNPNGSYTFDFRSMRLLLGPADPTPGPSVASASR